MTWNTLMSMSVTCDGRTFWWELGRPADATFEPLRAVIFDLDGALADIERDGQRVAFNAAFTEHGLDISWTEQEYGRLVCIGNEQRRIASALRRRGFGRVSDEIAAHVYRTKSDLFEESVLSGDIMPRAGLEDLVNGLYFAGISVGVVSSGSWNWVEALVRQLLGDGIAMTVVTPDDLTRPGREPDLHGRALVELGIHADGALAVAASARGLRAAAAAKLPTVVVPTRYTEAQDYAGAVQVRRDYDGLTAAACDRLHRRWWASR